MAPEQPAEEGARLPPEAMQEVLAEGAMTA